jgi:DNA-binding transcriptional MocR family regulator
MPIDDACWMHITVLMRDAVDDREIAARAMQLKVLVSPLSLAYLGSAPQKGFVLGFGNTQTAQMARAVRLLKKCLGR